MYELLAELKLTKSNFIFRGKEEIGTMKLGNFDWSGFFVKGATVPI